MTAEERDELIKRAMDRLKLRPDPMREQKQREPFGAAVVVKRKT